MPIEYYNGSQYVTITPSTILETNFVNNGSLRFRNDDATVGNSTEPWNIEFKGANIAKASNFNITNQVKALNDSTGHINIGFNSTAFLEFAQKLGVDSIVLNISQSGNRLQKCDENAQNCRDVTDQATLISSSDSGSVWEVPVYGGGGFSTYGVLTVGLNISSNKNIYQCFRNCTVYFNVTNTNSSLLSSYNITIKNTVIGSGTNPQGIFYNISYKDLNNNNQSWYVLSNLTGATNTSAPLNNYVFKLFNSSIPNETTHQFKIDIFMNIPVGVLSFFNLSLYNGSVSLNFTDNIFLDAINLSLPVDENVTNTQNSNFSFIMYSYNDTNQSCNLYIDSISSGGNSSVLNGNLTQLFTNRTITNGNHTWNISCTTDSGETGISETRAVLFTDIRSPMITSISSSSSGTSTVTVTLSATTDENATCRYSTTNQSYINMTSTMTANATGTRHTVNNDYTSTTSGTYYVRCNDTLGNYMTFSNFTTFSADVSSSSSSSSSSGGGGGGGGGSVTSSTNVLSYASKTWSSIKGGEVVSMAVKDPNIGIVGIDIPFLATLSSSSSVEVARLKDKPSDISTGPTESVYQYLKITPNKISDSDIGKATIKFMVDVSWLSNNALNEEEVSLYRYYVDSWVELPTTVKSGDDKEILYEAETPGFSVFAIAKEKSTALQFNEPQSIEEVSSEPESRVGIPENKPQVTGNVVSSPPPPQKKVSPWQILLILIAIAIVLGGALFIIMRRRRV